MHRIPAGLAIALALPALGQAQTDAPEPWRQDLLAAQDAAEGAYDSLARLPISPDDTGLEAERYALADLPYEAARRLGRDGHDREPFDPDEAREFLSDARTLLRERLAQLDPTRAQPTAEADAPPLVLRVYDVRDVAGYGVAEVFAPTLGLDRVRSFPVAGGVLCFCEDEDEAGAPTQLDPDKLIELLEPICESADDGEGSLEYTGGRLYVRKPEASHALVAAELAALRAQRLQQVELDVRAYALPAGAAAALRAASGDGLDEAEERALLAGATLVTRQRLLTRDGQRVVAEQVQLTSYQGDLEVNQTGVVPVLNPVVQQLRTGFALQLRPTVDRARGQVWLELTGRFSSPDGEPGSARFRDHELVLPRVRTSVIHGFTRVAEGRAAVLGGTLVGAGDAPLDVLLVIRPRLSSGGAR